MGVFLRWGILGILSVAALLYVYNASKHMARVREAAPVAAVNQPGATPAAGPDSAAPETAPALSPHCEVELLIARRALEMRGQAAPLDRVLRMQEIAWQEPVERRERLEKVATRWYAEAEPISAEALALAVLNDCERAAAEQPRREP